MNDRPKRITERQVAEGDDARLAALLAGELRVGTLQGVHVNLLHDQLPQGEWEAAPWWYVWPNTGIVFPGEAKFGMAELRERKAATDEEPAVFALEGDNITIERVEVEATDERFDHPHDREVRLAFLRIERPTGEVLRPDKPLRFFGVSHIKGAGKREAFDHIVERILRHAGVEALPSRTPDDLWGQPLEAVALESARQAHRAYFDLYPTLPPYEEGQARALLRIVANEAALAGFVLGKIEARKAEGMATAIMVNRERATAEVRRDDWRERAKAIWAEHPDYRRNRVTDIICDEFPDEHKRSIMRALKPLDPHKAG